MTREPGKNRRTLLLYLLCLGVLMVVLDTTVVTVALPSVIVNLRLSNAAATWMVNAYMLTFGGSLLLGGRLGDVYGHRRLFLIGIVMFSLASLACGISEGQSTVLIARGVQGLGGAVIASVSLSLIVNLSSEPREQAKAMGVYGFVCAAGGALGELLGGFFTQALGWHWIFLINLPVGFAVYVFCSVLLPRDVPSSGAPRHFDVAGALVITTWSTLLVYSLVNGNLVGWTSPKTHIPLVIAGVLMLLFYRIERRAQEPLIPPQLFTVPNVGPANTLAVLWAAGAFAWFVESALYLQRVLGYDPFQVGIAFVPSDVIVGAFSAGLSSKIVGRFGIRGPLSVGLLLAATGLALFARAPLNGTFLIDVLPGMLLLGLGGGMASTPLLLAAMSQVSRNDSGIASGVVNTSFMMGGALGLALLASLAEARTINLEHSGSPTLAALNGGYHVAFLAGSLLTAAAAILGAFMLRPRRSCVCRPITDTVPE